MSQTIWVARHGNRQDFVDSNWAKTAERPFDPGLSPDGIEQAQALAQRLQGEGITRIFASPFLRTIQTAHIVADVLQLPIQLEAGFSEYMNPVWFEIMPERLDLPILLNQFPRIDPTYCDRVLPQFPETPADVALRVKQTIQQLSEDVLDDFLIVGHGASVTATVRGLIDQPPDLRCALCSIFKLVRQGDRWTLELNGDISHLQATEEVIRFN